MKQRYLTLRLPIPQEMPIKEGDTIKITAEFPTRIVTSWTLNLTHAYIIEEEIKDADSEGS